MIDILPVGGYGEVGRNMTAIHYKGQVVLLDMGVHLERYIDLNDDSNHDNFSKKQLIRARAVPDTGILKAWKKKVVAIIPSHGHLDHIGAIPYLAKDYDAPIICSRYTGAVIKAILKDKSIKIPNKITVLGNNDRLELTDDITVEFVNITHSIPDTVVVLIHTPEGTVAYANDFKLDNTPTLGNPPNYQRLKELGSEGNVTALIMDSLYAHLARKTPSEAVAKTMLEEVMVGVDSKDRAMIVTTFSSQIARLRAIVEFAKKLKRRPIFLGRSLAKYVYAAQDCGVADFNDTEIVGYKSKIKRKLRQIERDGRDKYVIVCTGHQGEPRAVLSSIADRKLGFKLFDHDHIIFSCTVIPSSINIANREALEQKLQENHVRIFKDIHQSGHGSREDHREIINLIKPKHIIPTHASMERCVHLSQLAREMGYELGTDVHLLVNGQKLSISL